MNDSRAKDAIIRQLSHQRDYLLQELNHRVRNILQIVNGLLNTQLHYLRDKVAIETMRDSQGRIHALSLMYMHPGPNGIGKDRIAMHLYIGELVDYLTESYSIGAEISIEQQVDEIELELSQALPVGLIVHEAICNSIKYAFPQDGRGKIRVALAYTGECSLSLRVSDNGVGLPAPFFGVQNGRLGIQMMRGLAVELDASFEMKNDKGTAVSIDFKHKNLQK